MPHRTGATMNPKALWAEALARFNQLSGRERRMVTLTGLAVAAFVIFFLVFSLSSHANATRRRITEKLQKLEEARLLAASYREAEGARQAAEQRLGASEVR